MIFPTPVLILFPPQNYFIEIGQLYFNSVLYPTPWYFTEMNDMLAMSMIYPGPGNEQSESGNKRVTCVTPAPQRVTSASPVPSSASAPAPELTCNALPTTKSQAVSSLGDMQGKLVEVKREHQQKVIFS
jgi:hypothetical protein